MIMAIPSAKYAVDYTDGLGLKWSKQISQMYQTLGDVDLSATISSLNDNLAKMVYRKSRVFNPIYDNAITYASVGHDSLVMKYFSRNGYPSEEIISGTVLVNYASPDGQSYATGVNEDASVPYNGGLGDARILTDVEYNKMLFKVTLREMTLNTSDVPIGGVNYNDPSYTDVELKDIDDNKWYALYYHNGAKVWNGSSWSDANIAPVLICSGDSVQSFQGGGSAFNNLFNNYNGVMGSGQNIEFSNTASNYYWTAHNFVNRMNIENYSMGWSDSYDYKPSYADDFDSMKAFMLNYLTENSYSPWQSVWFQLCREVHEISNDMSILLTVMCYACLDGNNNLWINWDNIYTFPIIKGSSVSKFLAGHGLYYLTDSSADLTGITPDTLHNSSAIWVGEMSANGTTTGNWIKGADIENYNGYNKDGNINNPDFDPSGGGGGVDGDDIDDHKMGSGSQLSGIAQLWLLTRAQLQALHAAFANAPVNYDPMSSFISVMGLGISAIRVVGDSMPWTLNPINIRMSNGESWHTGVEGHIVDAQVSAFNEPNLKIQRRYNNFLDYSPYATHEIFLPMCGWVTLPDIAVDRKITVTYIPDIETLKCRAVVSVVDNSGNRCVVAEKDGVMGAEIPFTNIGHSLFLGNTVVQSADIAGEIVTGAIGAGFTKTNAQGGKFRPYEGFTVGMAGTLPGAIGNALVSGNINRTHFTTGNGSRIGFGDGENIQIKSTYHRIDKPTNYDHTIGKVCNKTGQLSDFKGFTVCDNPHITFSALEGEKEEIKRLLEQGVIL